MAGPRTGALRYALVASRWGRAPERRVAAFALLRHAALQARAERARLLVVDQTAAQPWVERAAELFGVPQERLAVELPRDRDVAPLEVADRVFALWVRRRGKMAGLLRSHLRHAPPGSVWVTVSEAADCAGRELVAAGAVGWRLTQPASDASSGPANGPAMPAAHVPAAHVPAAHVRAPQDVDWSQFFVHCTRGRAGAFPGQSVRAWRDEVILGGWTGQPASPFQVLQRILRCGWLSGTAQVTRQGQPVTCWSAVPLPQLLQRRTFRPHLGRWDYEPYGLAIQRQALQRRGGRPVIYGTAGQRAGLAAGSGWRFQAEGKGGIWRAEREWRLRGSLALASLGPQEMVVFVPTPAEAAALAPWSRWPLVSLQTRGDPPHGPAD